MATVAPDSVLRSIMPIFTFMGSNTLKQDDNYSFLVVERTLAAVIPALVASETTSMTAGSSSPGTGGGSGVANVAVSIMAVFVDAFDHIPTHRRMGLFAKLIATLGSGTYLYVAAALFLKRAALKGRADASAMAASALAGGNDAAEDSDVEFCMHLCQAFPAVDQLTSAHQLLVLYTAINAQLDAAPPTPVSAKAAKKHRAIVSPPARAGHDTATNAIFKASEHSPRQCRNFVYLVLSFASKALSAKPFLDKVVTVEREGTPSVQGVVQEEALAVISLALGCVLRIQSISSSGRKGIRPGAESDANERSLRRYWAVSLARMYDIIDKSNSLLSVPAFVNVVSSLLQRTDSVLKKKAVLLLVDRISNDNVSIVNVPSRDCRRFGGSGPWSIVRLNRHIVEAVFFACSRTCTMDT